MSEIAFEPTNTCDQNHHIDQTGQSEKNETFSIPPYPKKFLKTKLGRKCLFYSIVPYLCKYDTTDKTFKKIQLFCSLKKETLISEKIRKKYNFDDNCLALEKNLIDQSEKYRNFSYLKEALFVEHSFIKKIKNENPKMTPCGESKIKSMMVDNCLYFYHLYLVANSFIQQVEKTNSYSIERAVCRQETTDTDYCIKEETKRFNASGLGKIFERKGIKKLIPLLYGIYTTLPEKELKFYKRKQNRTGNQIDYIITRQKGGNLKDLFTKNDSKECDAIYANKSFLIENIYKIITTTNELFKKLKKDEKLKKDTNSKQFWKFDDEILKNILLKKEGISL